MIEKILYPTDFSPHAEKCVEYILQMKECGVKEVVLLHVIDEHIIKFTEEITEEAVTKEQVIAECHRTGKQKLQALAETFHAAGITTKLLLEEGIPFSKILEVADREVVSLIVLGHRGHNLAEELLLGSVAEKVARKSQRPVLLIR